MLLKSSLLLLSLSLTIFINAQKTNKGNITILYSPSHAANSFRPSETLGAAFDGHEQGDMDRILTKENIREMKTTGLGPISYRLRTELAMEVWHWNPKGTWSNPEHNQGYWVSDSEYTTPIQTSYGYRLPRRGNTHDQANDDDYSRIDDGDTTTFWKSNPYLDQHFTGDDNAAHPQWVIIDLGRLKEVNALRILWANPYALSYTLDYALDIGSDYFDPFQPGLWHSISHNTIANNINKNRLVVFSKKPIQMRFLRITMMHSSNTAIDNKSTDIRDKLGFAVKEIEAGLLDKDSAFHDWVHHAPDNTKQSVIHVSSNDPWHRASDLDVHTEQAGIDRFFTCGLTNNQPALMPAGLLYDTPDNMAACLRYLTNRNYPVREMELGEEPEGQLVNPKDYAALYLQWARRLKQIRPDLKLGGPGFAALAFTEDDGITFTEREWTSWFLNYLKKHNALSDFNFFTTEWYPFDNICDPTPPQLAIAPRMLTNALKDFQQKILPKNTPVYVTEYGYSAYGGKAEVEIEGALMYADILGRFLTLGGGKSFLYGYEPAYLEQKNHCDWGNNMLFGMDENGKIIYHVAAYFGICMLTHYWAIPSDSVLKVYPVTSSILNKNRQELVSAYAVERPGHKWSIVLINKDPQKEWNVTVSELNEATGHTQLLNKPADLLQYSHKEYHWKSDGSDGYPTLALPPEHQIINHITSVALPPYSLTVISEQ